MKTRNVFDLLRWFLARHWSITVFFLKGEKTVIEVAGKVRITDEELGGWEDGMNNAKSQCGATICW